MADKPNNKTPETPEPEAPEAQEVQVPEPEAPVTETPATQAPEAPEVQAPEPEAPATPVEEAPADVKSPAAETPEPEAPAVEPAEAAPIEPAEQLSSKERRRRARSTHSGEAGPTRSPEDRHAERVSERRAKAVRRRARRLQERAKRTAKRQGATDAPARELAPVHAAVEGRRSVRQGIVMSDKADKTITVRIDFARRHRRYEKIVRSSSTLHAHDEENDAREGDVVRVIESRPLSKRKRWKLVDVLERAR